MKFGIDTIDSRGMCFQYSDDTEEAIVLVNHLFNKHHFYQSAFNQDEFARELAIRYYTRDPDGEIYGYGLTTRKVLSDIYHGEDWRVANQTTPKVATTSFVDRLFSQCAQSQSLKQAISTVCNDVKIECSTGTNQVSGSCGNGSAMRVAPLGAWYFEKSPEFVVEMATSQSVVTHCHPEGIAGSIAVSLLARWVSHMKSQSAEPDKYAWHINDENIYDNYLLKYTPKSLVYDGIVKAKNLPLDTPLNKVVETLGNGNNVTCQDTVPLCVFLTIKMLKQGGIETMYERAIMETCMCFGDVDTNCAIVGGVVGIISDVPEKWKRYCQPMEGVYNKKLPEQTRKKKVREFVVNKKELKDTLSQIKPFNSFDLDGTVSIQSESLFESECVLNDSLGKERPSFEDVYKRRKLALTERKIEELVKTI
jgi:ADP-ribosylglycohydrolase